MQTRGERRGTIVLIGLTGLVFWLLPAYSGMNHNQASGPVLDLDETALTDADGEVRIFYRGEPIHIRLRLRYARAIDARQRAINAGAPHAPIPTLRLTSPGMFWGDAVLMGLYRRTLVGWQDVESRFPWQSMMRPGHAHQPSEQSEAGEALGAQSWEVFLTVPPGAAAGWDPGQYALRAAFDNTEIPGDGVHRVRLEARPFEFSVREPATDSEQGRVLAEQAGYLVDVSSDFAAGEALARRAVELAPEDERGWSALGSACFRQGEQRYPDAIAAYERYLELYRARRPHAFTNRIAAIVAAMRRQLADRN